MNKKQLFLSLIVGAAATIWGGTASANDTSVTLGIGGLEVARTDAVQMVSEDLFISMEQVRVRYVFRNRTDKDVTSLVAFPLPDLKAEDQESPIGIPKSDDANFVNFKTKVDGVDVHLLVEHKATLNGVDHTAELVAAGAPLNPLAQNFADTVAKLSPAVRDGLVARGLMTEEKYDQGKGWETYWRPAWDLSTKFYREQTFPAGKDVVVEHAYEPIVGGTVAAVLNAPDLDPNTLSQYQKDYCVTPGFRKAERRFGYMGATEAWLTYILKTGANWAGPIQSFKLTVDKGRADNLVSFCGAGVRKISPTQFEMRATNFTPKADLNFLFIIPHQQ